MSTAHDGRIGLRAARQRAQLSQMELATKAGLALATISLAERTGVATAATVSAIATALGIDSESIEMAIPTSGRAGVKKGSADPAPILRQEVADLRRRVAALEAIVGTLLEKE